jgi:hypothetical protein
LSNQPSKTPAAKMKEISFGKLTCRCGHVNLIAMDKPWIVDKPIRCENCGRIIVQTEKSVSKKWGDKIAAAVSRHFRPRTA